MKKKLLSVLLAVTLMVGVLAGCGEKEDNKEDKTVENVQGEASEGEAEEKNEDKTADSNVVDLGNGMMMEYPGEDDGLIELEGAVTVIEDDAVSVENTENEWAEAYEDYYTREDILPENMRMTTSTALQGVSLDIVIATAGDESYMRYDIGSAAIDLYAAEGKVYARTEADGAESWIYAPVTSEDELNSLLAMSAEDKIVDPSYVTACVYVEEVVEDGVTYDVLLLKVDDGSIAGEAYYYVNRETQKVGKYTMEAEGELVECLVEEISSIEIPAEAATATEATADEILYAMYMVLFAASGM